ERPVVGSAGEGTARKRLMEEGLRSLEKGLWAVATFAGGAGTRFASELEALSQLEHPNRRLRLGRFRPNMPKGTFPISPVAGLSFLELGIGYSLGWAVRARRMPPLLFMTSELTHEQTRAFLAGACLWGLDPAHLVLFRQGQVPRLDEKGRLVVMADGSVCTTGDGHGGIYKALTRKEGGKSVLEELTGRGVRHIVMHNVDNPVARALEPVRLGYHLLEDALFTISIVRRRDTSEKVGVVVRRNDTGRIEVVEYSVLPPGLGEARAGDGSLLFDAANVNTNIVACEAVRPDIEPTLYTGKKVQSRTGQVGASSYEMLNQHLTRLLDPERVKLLEVERDEFFMPTKSVLGEGSSVQSTARALSRLYRQRLEQAGARVAESAVCDLHPACLDAVSPESMGVGDNFILEERSRLYLGTVTDHLRPEQIFEGGVVLEPDSELIVIVKAPWGKISIDSERRVELDPNSRSRLHVKGRLRVERGVSVVMVIGEGATIEVPAGHTFRHDEVVSASAGTTVTI
ncbi:MAG: hypothetical protein D6806_09680, partial [Deltaproteobacteria bacterium]